LIVATDHFSPKPHRALLIPEPQQPDLAFERGIESLRWRRAHLQTTAVERVQLSLVGGIDSPRLHHVHNITNFLKPRQDASSHRRLGPQRLMDAHEIAVRREQRDRIRVVSTFLLNALVSRIRA
jgi:hypothetical protein